MRPFSPHVGTLQSVSGEVSAWPQALASAIETIIGLMQLPVGWDGTGGPQIQMAAVTEALQVLSLAEWGALPAPNLGPVPGGGIQFEWCTPRRELELEILPDGSADFVQVHENGEMHGGHSTASIADEVGHLTRWLIQG